MARKVGQIIARGDRRWLIRVYLGRDHETNKRNYHNRTIHGPMREAQAYLTRKLRERDLGRDLEGAKISLNEYLDRWLETAVRPRVRAKTFQDYKGMLRRYVRPILGERVLAGMRPLDLQTMYQQMSERGLSARTVRYAHVVDQDLQLASDRVVFCCCSSEPCPHRRWEAQVPHLWALGHARSWHEYCFPGFSLHDELALLVESGLTPLAALQAATRNAAIFMNAADRYGSVAKGKIADLILLDADPLQDIRNTTKISYVFLSGREFDRGALNEMLRNAEAIAKSEDRR